MFSLSPVMFIAAMAIRNIQLRNCNHISHEYVSNAHHFAENLLQIGQYTTEIIYSKIGSDITNMLENALQSVACDFDTSQGL